MKTTLALIDECINTYLPPRIKQGPRHFQDTIHTKSPSNQASMPSETPSSQLRTQMNNPKGPSSERDIPSPTRAPPPPPSVTESDGPSMIQSPSTNIDVDVNEDSKSIFRPLENYIIACFARADSLNASFLTTTRPPLQRAVSEGAPVKTMPQLNRDDEPVPFPELDAKTLLLGDVAENGTWWTGKAQTKRTEIPRTKSEAAEDGTDDIVDSRTPRIDWQEVDEWYISVFAAGQKWRNYLNRIQETDVSNQAGGNPIVGQQIDQELSGAAHHLQRTVLKASENLLRRPGRTLKSPSDSRFLLLLLANPLLYPSELHKLPGFSERPRKGPDMIKLHQSGLKPPPENGRRFGSSSRSNQNLSGTVHNKHTGIVKRILGLMSTQSVECHQHLVSWLSRFDEPRFRRLVDLINSFVSHRLSRQHRRKRSNSHDPMAGLIPDISGPGAGTSAQLHAALGTSSSVKVSGSKEVPQDYFDDWQVKAASKCMSLLFSANNNDWPYFKHDGGKPSSAPGRHRAGSAARKRTHRHGQIVATSSFYNTLVDYADLVADFEVWESRRGKFSFCQYPMFLSIWAKIRIMEHDAHRQMEIKAREAFFNSILSRKTVNQYLVLKVRRDCLVEDSLRNVSEVVGTGQEEIKKGLRIDFVGEEGFDSGGLRKEWFLLLVREVFDPEHGLFVYDEDSQYCYFNPYSFETSDQFFLVGVLLGLAIYNSNILDVALPPFAFRKLLASAPAYTGPSTFSSRPIPAYTLDDLSEYRPKLAQGLRQLLDFDGDVESTFLQDFAVVAERYGQPVTIPLCPNGEKRPVTNTNRREFVDLYVRYILDSSVSRQYEPFKRGFFTVCGGNALSLFRPEEIELLVRGSDEPLDVAMLRSVAIYDNWGKGFDPAKEPVVMWFWQAFIGASPKDQRKLLSFITASDRIPAMGAGSLVIKVVYQGDHPERFPTARTCFNMVSLYRYPSQEKLEEKLWKAVEESEGFGIR